MISDRTAARIKSENSLTKLFQGRPLGDEEGTTYCSVPGCNQRAYHGFCARHGAERHQRIRREQEETMNRLGIKKFR